jgi:hypothetical protein
MSGCILFYVLLLSHLVLGVWNETTDPKNIISFEEYLKGKSQNNGGDKETNLANLAKVRCKEGYGRVGGMCRKIFKGVRIYIFWKFCRNHVCLI